MNDLPPPIDPVDAAGEDPSLLSAVLDGEATPAEVALVDADPRLTARLDLVRRLRDEHRALAADEAAPLLGTADDRIALAIAAAGDDLAHVETAHDPVQSTPVVPAPTPIGAGRRSPRSRRALPILAGVAAALVVVVLGAVVVRGGSSGDTTADGVESPSITMEHEGARDVAPNTDEDAGAQAGTGMDKAEGGAADAQAPTPSPPLSTTTVAAPAPSSQGLVDLGSFTSIDELRSAALDATIGRIDPSVLACALPHPMVPTVGAAVAELDRRQVIVVVGADAATSSPVLIVLDSDTCQLVD